MARRERPREMPDMTPAQRWANWWHYHWRHVLLGAVVLVLLGGHPPGPGPGAGTGLLRGPGGPR